MKIIIASMIATLGFSSAVNAEEQCHKLVWQDHFDQPQLNPKNWQVTTGDGCDISLCGWGNNEVQWYSEDNLSINDGKLVIMARAEEKGGRNYTSAKINSEGRFYQQYGRFEARLRLPSVPCCYGM